LAKLGEFSYLVGEVLQFVVLEVEAGQLTTLADLFRQVLQLVVAAVAGHQGLQRTDTSWKLTDVVLSDGEVGQVDKIPKLVVHHPDPVEPHVECGEAGQLVDHRRDLREPVVAAVEDPEDLEVCQLLRQGCDHVLRKRQRFQVPQESYLRRKSGESVGI